jgi:dihydrofolate reductase
MPLVSAADELRSVERSVGPSTSSLQGEVSHGQGHWIRQALAAGLVDELTIIIAPVVLGAGKRLFDGFSDSLELEPLGVRQSRFATFIDYRAEPT